MDPQHRASGEILTQPHYEPSAADVLLDRVVHVLKTLVPINLKDGPEHVGVAFQHIPRDNHGVRCPKPHPARDERVVPPPNRTGTRRDLHGALLPRRRLRRPHDVAQKHVGVQSVHCVVLMIKKGGCDFEWIF